MPNIELEIYPSQIKEAKQEQAKFDLQKTHNKFQCNTNYIGYLGELVFNNYLNNLGINFNWLNFTKQGWDEPDFTINGKSIDLKTTFSDSMWIQQEKFDVYIYAQINQEQNLLTLNGWLSKKDIARLKKNKLCDIVRRGNREDYVFKQFLMRRVDDLFNCLR